MITANEARLLLKDSTVAIENQLSQIEIEIRKACERGEDHTEVSVSADYFLNPVMIKLKGFHYRCHQTHSKGIFITWG